MSLTSPATLAISATITVALFALLNIKWSSLKNIWLRMSSLLVLQVFLLATVGLVLNNQNGLYNSWSELFGISTSTNKNIPAKAIDLKKAQFYPDGSAIVERGFTGTDSKITAEIWFYLPKRVVQTIQSHGDNKYPVAMFLSGSPGVPTAWLHGLKLHDQIKEAKKSVKLKDFIGVLPDYNVQPHSDTGCMNIPGGVQVEDWLTKDVYKYVLNNLPAKSDKWLISGYSTGGWCSAMLSLKHPEIFKAAAPIAGYYRPEFNFKISQNQKKELRQRYDLLALAKTRPAPLDVYVITSKLDQSSYSSSVWFTDQIGSSHTTDLLVLPSGGHNFSTWRPIVQDVLKWFAGELI